MDTRLLGRQLTTAVTRRIEFVAKILQRFLEFGETDANNLQLFLQLAIALLRGFAFGGPSDLLLGETRVLHLALLLLGGGGIDLGLQLIEARRYFAEHRVEPLHGCCRAATALFERGQACSRVAGVLGGLIATLTQFVETALCSLHLGLERELLVFVGRQFSAEGRDGDFAFSTFRREAPDFAGVGGP